MQIRISRSDAADVATVITFTLLWIGMIYSIHKDRRKVKIYDAMIRELIKAGRELSAELEKERGVNHECKETDYPGPDEAVRAEENSQV